jgi:hypothetical protein
MKKIIILFILIFTPAKASEKAQRDEHWPRPFVPSEQIGADSVVSFPADI